MNKQNIPKLRFPEFKGEWEKKKLGEVGSLIGGGTPSTQNLKFWSGNIPWVSSSDLTDDSIYQISTTRFITNDAIAHSATKLIPQKSILIVSRVGVGKVAINNTALCTSQDFTNLIPNENNYIFLAYLLKIKTNRLLEFNQGTSIKGFVKSDLETLGIEIPSLPEQTRIASFFTVIDKKLSQLKQKKNLLEEYKKGVMQKLFSQELRFKIKNEDGELIEPPKWEKKRLGECLDYIQPTNYLVSSTDYDNSYKIPVLTAGKTFILGYTNETDGIFENNLPVIIFDDFTTATQFVDFPFKAKSSAMKILIAKENANIKFMFEAMQIMKYEIGGHERHWITKFAQIEILIPCLAEQTLIANFLTAIDKKIMHCEKQIEQTEIWKKGLLQKMFV